MATDQPEAEASFDERFSPELRARPVFTLPQIQEVLASLPPPTDLAEPVTAEAEGEPRPADHAPPVAAREPETEIAASVPNQEIQLPDFPPPPPPAEVVLPSAEELAAAQPPSPADTTGAAPSGPIAQAQAPTPTVAPTVAPTTSARRPAPNRRAAQRSVASSRQAPAQDGPAVTGTVPGCTTGASCLSQRQSVAIFFGFLAGALLGGPIGALVGGATGAIMTSGPPPQTGTKPAAKR